MTQPRRVLLKFSGERIAGVDGNGPVDTEVLNLISQHVKALLDDGIQVAIVTGGGNFYRGRDRDSAVQELTAHKMGMLGSIMSSLALCDGLRASGIDAEAMSMVQVPQFVDLYRPEDAAAKLEAGKVVVLGGGTVIPGFTTDTAAATFAKNLDCDVLLKGTNVEGVYDKDPNKHNDALLYEDLTYDEALSKQLHVMDMTAFAWCRQYDIPIIVFSMDEDDAPRRAIEREIGTMIQSA